MSNVTDMLQFPISVCQVGREDYIVRLLDFGSCSFQQINWIMEWSTTFRETLHLCCARQGDIAQYFCSCTFVFPRYLGWQIKIRIILLALFSRQTNKSTGTATKINQKSCRLMPVDFLIYGRVKKFYTMA